MMPDPFKNRLYPSKLLLKPSSVRHELFRRALCIFASRVEPFICMQKRHHAGAKSEVEPVARLCFPPASLLLPVSGRRRRKGKAGWLLLKRAQRCHLRPLTPLALVVVCLIHHCFQYYSAVGFKPYYGTVCVSESLQAALRGSANA